MGYSLGATSFDSTIESFRHEHDEINNAIAYRMVGILNEFVMMITSKSNTIYVHIWKRYGHNLPEIKSLDDSIAEFQSPLERRIRVGCAQSIICVQTDLLGCSKPQICIISHCYMYSVCRQMNQWSILLALKNYISGHREINI